MNIFLMTQKKFLKFLCSPIFFLEIFFWSPIFFLEFFFCSPILLEMFFGLQNFSLYFF